jgi:hypothetical protein
MSNLKKTGKKVSSNAGRILTDKNASNIQKKLAASALAQSKTKKQTSSKMETVASAVLKSPKYNNETKALAASVLTQSNK